MSDKSYPFPSRKSTYWLDPATGCYDETVRMFEAQSDEDKKRNKTQQYVKQHPKKSITTPSHQKRLLIGFLTHALLMRL